MKEYRIFFRPTFHDHINLCLQIERNYAIFFFESPPYSNRREALSFDEEISPELLEVFYREISAVDPLLIRSLMEVGRDGITIECFYSDNARSNEFSVWSPRGDEYRNHLVFINSVYQLARRVFIDKDAARLLENLNFGRYFD